jgi:hypothetical protein
MPYAIFLDNGLSRQGHFAGAALPRQKMASGAKKKAKMKAALEELFREQSEEDKQDDQEQADAPHESERTPFLGLRLCA